MTSGSSKSSDLGQEQFDIAPLSWVMTELREALSNAGKLLVSAIGQDAEAQATSLLQAKSYLHQAHGALQIVEIEGVAIVTETVEEIIEKIQSGKLENSQDVANKITEAFYAVLRYLEDLLAGNPQQPVRLYPEYRALLELKGAERIHPADLFFPSLSVQEKIPELTLSAHPAAINYGAIRLRFEKLLLTLLTSKNAEAKQDSSAQMSVLIHEIEQAQTTSQTKAFWLVMRAFAESTAQVEAKDERHIKQIWGRINLQIRRLVEGNTSVPERLLRDALFFIAQVKEPSAFVSQIRKAYQLDNHVPSDYDQKRYGLIAPHVLASAKELLGNIKNLWGRISNGDTGLSDKFFQKMKDLADVGAGLQSPPLAKLLRELNGIASHAVRAKDQERMGLELATCLLFLENAFEQITHLPANFATRADEISARLLSVVGGESPGNQAGWIGEISREAQQRQTMTALVGEMQMSLKHAEKALDEHFRDASNTTILAPVDGTLAQIGGALAILDQDEALAAVAHTRELVKQCMSGDALAEADVPALHQKVAQNIGALSFFIETLQNQPELAKKRFVFDAQEGIFQSKLLEKAPEKELLPSAPLEANFAAPPVATAEQDLLQQQKESERLLASLVDAPQNSELQAQLKDSLDHERSFAALLDDSEASARAKTAIDLLSHTDFSQPDAALNEIVAATTQTEAAPEIQLTQELPETEAEIDAELLEIFLMEADEVLEAVRENIPLSRHDSANQEYLIRLRRSFHTLKGSGRMVGLNVFGEGAWNIEQVMNLWLSDSRSGTEALYALLEYAAAEMFDWVEELKRNGNSSRNSDAIIAAALRVKDGLPFSVEPVASAPVTPITPVAPIEVVQKVDAVVEARPDVITPDLTLEPSVNDITQSSPALDSNEGSASVLPELAALVDLAAPEELSQAVELILPTDQALVLDPVSSIVAESEMIDAQDLVLETSESVAPQAETEVADAATASTEVIEAASAEIQATTASDNLDDLASEAPIFGDIKFDEEITLEAADVAEVNVAHDEGAIGHDEDAVLVAHSVESELPMISDVLNDLMLEASELTATSVEHEAEVKAEAEAEAEAEVPVESSLIAIDTDSLVQTPESISEAVVADDLTSPNLLESEVEELAASPAEALQQTSQQTQQQTAQIIEFPDFSMPALKENDNTKRIGEIEISLPLHTIYMAETDEIVRFLQQDFSEWRHEPARPVSRHAVHAAHSLAGSSATVGLFSVQELAHSLENVLQRLERHPVNLENAEFDTLDHAVECVKSMLQKFALSEMADRAPAENQKLSQLLEVIITRSNVGDDEEFITSTNERLDAVMLDTSATQADVAIANNDSSAESNALAEVTADEGIDAVVDAVVDVAPELVNLSESETLADASPVATEDVEAVPESAVLELSVEDTSAPQFSVTLSNSDESNRVDVSGFDTVIPVVATAPASAPASAPLTETNAETENLASLDRSSTDIELKVRDEIDHDLLPVFLEEGNDLLPMIGQLLRSWQQSPEDDAIPQSILRLMHTVKGSARMAGAMQLGQHTHDMETRIENLMHTGSTIRQPLLEDLIARQDYAMHLFERLQNPDLASVELESAPVAELTVAQEINQFQDALQSGFDPQLAAEEVSSDLSDASELNVTDSESGHPTDQLATNQAPAADPTALAASATSAESNKAPEQANTALARPVKISSAPRQLAPQAAVSAASAPVPLVRVRADILDRLVNQAGEVSISRSKLENEVDTLKASLSELTENVSRLRDQLREVEIQAETQITSRMAFSGDREFDPLEFDRFTRLQELTRMMAESVSDVATVQTALNRTIEGATTDLNVQARLTRELQQDLMRVRMIPFSSVSERLYRIARQTAKEVDKRVNLDIRGTSVEIDRSVLEKMVAPFEHMLRNAIVHGIESRQDRVGRGKSEVGELLIEIRQEGNEVVIHFTDDGQGLNINRIREKAKTVGLLTDESFINESDVVNLIFEPGFSTASEVTELAGRGVGMDVVRSEAASLGGRVSVTSIEGQGAHFTIHLPLTLAVTQVVILNAGGKTFAVPSVLVEQVQQLKSAALANAYNDGAIMWQGNRVSLHYLPSMLGERDATPDTQQYTPILIMKSDNERVAIHVDQIIGNREVVVKNVGPQLARMIGIAGATVLGSGNIVLILNPVPLAQKLEYERAKLPDASVDSTPEMGAVAEMVEKVEAPATLAPVQGLRSHHIVMVVDDSLTVRRVTQRLLVREGYQVVLAKDGIDALEQLQSITPDVMLVDIEMPRMDGFDLTRNVRSDSRTTHIPIIMITSRTADKHRNYAAELGVNEYFGKPYREDDLLAAISGFVNKPAEVLS